MSRDTHLLNHRSIPTLDFDFFLNNLSLFPLAHKFVLARIIRMKLLDIEILNIRDSVRDTPGNMLVVSDNDTRGTRETSSNDINIFRHEMAFIPDRGCSLSQVRIITQNSSTCFG